MGALEETKAREARASDEMEHWDRLYCPRQSLTLVGTSGTKRSRSLVSRFRFPFRQTSNSSNTRPDLPWNRVSSGRDRDSVWPQINSRQVRAPETPDPPPEDLAPPNSSARLVFE